MEQAESLMGSRYAYNGTNTNRQKVVVFFTDGIPTEASDFETDVADNAINRAKNLKDNGVTVYSVGIFKGADPNEMYGASGFDTNSDGTVNSKWIMDTWGLFPGTDFPEADRPAGNRFLNYLSSNSSNATSVGLTRATSGLGILHYKITYTITKNHDRIANNYYLTADNAKSLNEIFQTISNNIQTADISLDSTTVVKDIVSPYFNVPANANNIKVYTAACEGKDKWGKDEEVSSLTVDITNDTVSVTGFDFNENFVTEDLKEDGTRGKKLIIEFTVTAKDDFLGGNQVVTNGDASGIYDKDGTCVGNFEVPDVDVPIGEVEITPVNANVYLGASYSTTVSSSEINNEMQLTIGGVLVDLKKPKENYGLADWQNEYVDIKVEVKDENGNPVTDFEMLEDKKYSVTVTVTPKFNDAVGNKTPISGNRQGTIHVFTPELTFKDSEVSYMASIANYDYDKNDYAEIKWRHQDAGDEIPKYSTDPEVTMLGKAPNLTYEYTPDATRLIEDKKVKATDYVPVAVKVKLGETDVTNKTTFVHQYDVKPEDTCEWAQVGSVNGNPAFLLHVKDVYADLTITKSGADTDADPGQSFLFTVTGPDNYSTEVIIVGNGSVTLKNLKIGTYTVTEDPNWSWRYTPTNNGQKITLEANGNNEVTINNTRNKDQWLDGNVYADNKFTGAAATTD